jgi:hypothetical protein
MENTATHFCLLFSMCLVVVILEMWSKHNERDLVDGGLHMTSELSELETYGIFSMDPAFTSWRAVPAAVIPVEGETFAA